MRSSGERRRRDRRTPTGDAVTDVPDPRGTDAHGTGPPFTTVVLAKTGAGKTTTLNRLTGLDWATDPVVACTTRPAEVTLTRAAHPRLNRPAHRLIDLPGLGESREADRKYLPWYREWAGRADRVLYLIQADTRAYKQDQIMLSAL